MGPLPFNYFKALFNISDLAKYQVTINYILALEERGGREMEKNTKREA